MAFALLKKVVRLVTDIHIALYRMSGGKVANKVANMPLLLIKTSGRKSGKTRTSPLVYIREGQNYLVAASAGGANWYPDWYLNLRHKPEAKIEIGKEIFDVDVTFTEGEERTRLFQAFKDATHNFAKYEQKTVRVIPVMRLIPVENYETPPRY